MRAFIAALISALLSGVVGFVSAFYLQQRAEQQRIRAIQEEHALALRVGQTERTYALYGQWSSPEMDARRTAVAEILRAHPGQNYSALRESNEISPADIGALNSIVGFLGTVDDQAEGQLIDSQLAQRLLGPYMGFWGQVIPRLRDGMNEDDAGYGRLVLAERGLARLGATAEALSPRDNSDPQGTVEALPDRDEVPSYSPPED